MEFPSSSHSGFRIFFKLLLLVLPFLEVSGNTFLTQVADPALKSKSLEVSAGILRDGGVDLGFNAVPGDRSSVVINTILPIDSGKKYVGGRFGSIYGKQSKNIALLEQDGTVNPSFDVGYGPNGDITKINLQPDGKILVSGAFTTFNGIARSYIVRLNTDGSVDQSFNVTTNATQPAVCAVQPDGKVLIFGEFTMVNGIPRKQLARLDSSGNTDLTFDFGSGAPNTFAVRVLKVLNDGKFYLGGNFSSINGVPRECLVKLNSDGSVDNSFVFGQFASLILDIQLYADGRILATSGNGRVLRFLADGSADTTFLNPIFTSTPRFSAIQPDGKIIVGGDFTLVMIGNVTNSRSGLARINSDGSLDPTFIPFATSADYAQIYAAFVEPDGGILIGGGFSHVQALQSSGIARLKYDGNVDSDYLGSLGRCPFILASLVQPDGKIMLLGSFDTLNGIRRSAIGRINSDGSVDSSFSADPTIHGVATFARQNDGKYMLAGSLGTNSSALWRVNTDGSLDNTFQPATLNSFGYINTIVIQGDKILIGGVFSKVNNISRSGFAKFDSIGSLDPLILDTAGINTILPLTSGGFLIGGSFSGVNSTPSQDLAKIKEDGTVDAQFPANFQGTFKQVFGLYESGGAVYVASWWKSTTPNLERSPLVKIDTNGNVDLKFNPDRLASASTVFSVSALSYGKLLVGGNFNTFAESGTRKYLVRLLANGGLDYTFDAGSFTSIVNNGIPYVRSVADLGNNQVFFAGNFDSLAGQTKWDAARLNVNQCVSRAASDFDGDGKSDIAVFRPSDRIWYRLKSWDNGFRTYQYGLATDKLVPADFDGDGMTDIATFRPSSGMWFISRSSDSADLYFKFGTNEDIPIPADYDGDGFADIAVFRPSTGVWYMLQSSQGFAAIQFGLSGDKPVPADYDGDCRADISVFRPSNGSWYRMNSSNSAFFGTQFGVAADIPVPADYDGDGRTDIAVFRQSDGAWYIQNSPNSNDTSFTFGLPGDLPAVADFDGDGKADISVFRPSTGFWYENRTSSGFAARQFGRNGDIPVATSNLLTQ